MTCLMVERGVCIGFFPYFIFQRTGLQTKSRASPKMEARPQVDLRHASGGTWFPAQVCPLCSPLVFFIYFSVCQDNGGDSPKTYNADKNDGNRSRGDKGG